MPADSPFVVRSRPERERSPVLPRPGASPAEPAPPDRSDVPEQARPGDLAATEPFPHRWTTEPPPPGSADRHAAPPADPAAVGLAALLGAAGAADPPDVGRTPGGAAAWARTALGLARRHPAAAVAGVAVVVVLAVAGAVAFLVLGRGATPAAPLTLGAPGPSPAPGAGPSTAPGPPAVHTPGASTTTPTTAPPEPVVVHAAGAVARPGVYRLAAGARVADLLDAAGGASPEADLEQVNLASRLADGERIRVPARGEPPLATPVAGSGSAPGGVTSGARPAGAGPGPGAPVDVNTADVTELDTLPGVGPVTAAAIVEHRARNGPFTSVDGLLEVPGIGPARLDAIRDLVRV